MFQNFNKLPEKEPSLVDNETFALQQLQLYTEENQRKTTRQVIERSGYCWGLFLAAEEQNFNCLYLNWPII